MKLSIIIPLYNKEKFILKTLDSIYSLDLCGTLEVLVVDDCSTDFSLNLVEEYILEKKMKNFKLYKAKENLGPSNARNIGLRHSKGEYIMFLDADDSLIKKNFESLIKHLNQDIICCLRQYENKNNIKPNIKNIKKQMKEIGNCFFKFLNFEKIIEKEMYLMGGSGNLIIKRSIIGKNIFNVKEKIFEDWGFFFKILEQNKNKIFLYAKPIVLINDLQNDSLSKIKIKEIEKIKLPSIYFYIKELSEFNTYQKKVYFAWLYNNLKRLSNVSDKYIFFKKYWRNTIKELYLGKYPLGVIKELFTK